MNNPMLSNLPKRSLPSNLSNMVKMFKSMKNPQAMLQQNPQFKYVMNLVNQNGGNAKAAFYKLAEEKGIDPDQIIKLFK